REYGTVLPVLVESRPGYQNLCRLLTRAHLRAAKNQSTIQWSELPDVAQGLVALTGDEEGPLIRAILRPGSQTAAPRPDDEEASPSKVLQRLLGTFGRDRLFVEVQRHHLRDEERILKSLTDLAAQHRV